MSRMAKLRPRSASLKALPPDPNSLSGEVLGFSAAIHWTLNAKDKATASTGSKVQRPLKSVSLKLAKGPDSPSPTAQRSNSAGVAWGSGELVLDARQAPKQANSLGIGGGSGPPSRGSSGSEAPPSGRLPLHPPPGAREKNLSSTAPATVGRPPPAPVRAEGEVQANLSQKAAVRSPKARSSASSAYPVEDNLSRPNSAHAATAAIYASLPRTPGGTRTFVPDRDGFIFRPLVEAEVKPLPKRQQRGGIAAMLQSRVSNQLSKASPLPESDLKLLEEIKQQKQIQQLQQLKQKLQKQTAVEAEFEAPLPPPRIAWTEGSRQDDSTEDSVVLELAAQLRRDFLARQLASSEEESSGSGNDNADVSKANRAADKRVLRTDDARLSMSDLEASLEKARERSERTRLELGGYLENLRSKTFKAPEPSVDAPEEEPLVEIPADFEDVVDMNASVVVAARRRPVASKATASTLALSRVSSKPSASSSSSSDAYKLPSFLEKYFDEEKAVEQLPFSKFQKQEEQSGRPVLRDELEKGWRQIAKLDSLLVKREAAAAVRLKSSNAELEATKERIRRESEQDEAEKLEMLKKLKEKGFLRSSAPSCASSVPSVNVSRAPSEPSQSTLNSARGSQTALVPVAPEDSFVDWSSWACSAEDASSRASPLAPTPGTPSGSTTQEDLADEPDTETFNLTSTTADLTSIGSRTQASRHASQASSSKNRRDGDALVLAPVPEDEEVVADPPVVFPELEDDLYAADPYDLDALRKIDEQLSKLVPEHEWEAKSIRSLPALSDTGSTIVSGSVAPGKDGSKARSVWSHLSSGSQALPGDPVLREHLEIRETQATLLAIDSRLRELQVSPTGSFDKPPEPEELRKLLLQALSDTTPAEAKDKVLALAATSEMGSSLAEALHGAIVPVSSRAIDSRTLHEARQILSRLSAEFEDFDSAFQEAEFSLEQAEQGLRSLEAEAASSAAAPVDVQLPPTDTEPILQLASKLEELHKEATELAEREGPCEALLRNIRDEPETIPMDGTVEDGDTNLSSNPGESTLGLPVLSGAAGSYEDEDLDDLLLEDGGQTPSTPDDLAMVAEPVSLPELPKAIELELPSGEGQWDDEELQRVMRAMDQHFGDALPDLPDLNLDMFVPDDDVKA